MAEIQKMTDELAKEMTVYIPKKPQTFEEYLQNRFTETYPEDCSTKEAMEANYERWLDDEDVNQIMELAQNWGNTLI